MGAGGGMMQQNRSRFEREGVRKILIMLYNSDMSSAAYFLMLTAQ